MLTIEEFKETLPSDNTLTEEEILKLRNDMDKLAEIMFNMWLRDRNKTKENNDGTGIQKNNE